MVTIIEKTEHQKDRVTLPKLEGYELIVLRRDNHIISVEFRVLHDVSKGFLLSFPNGATLDFFIELLKEFINVRQL